MNHLRVYNQIIDRAKSEPRIKGGDTYYEAHHIIPECMGGSGKVTDLYSNPNIVLLTAREHFLCHWLLHEIYPANTKLAVAFHIMCRVSNNRQSRYTPSSRIIEYAKLKMKEAKKLFRHSDETKRIIGEAGKGRIVSKESIAKRVATRRAGDNYVRSREALLKDSNSKKGVKFSEEHKKRISEGNKKRWIKLSEEERKAIFKSTKGKPKVVVECPYCNKVGGEGAMHRWHFNNCKNKTV